MKGTCLKSVLNDSVRFCSHHKASVYLQHVFSVTEVSKKRMAFENILETCRAVLACGTGGIGEC